MSRQTLLFLTCSSLFLCPFACINAQPAGDSAGTISSVGESVMEVSMAELLGTESITISTGSLVRLKLGGIESEIEVTSLAEELFGASYKDSVLLSAARAGDYTIEVRAGGVTHRVDVLAVGEFEDGIHQGISTVTTPKVSVGSLLTFPTSPTDTLILSTPRNLSVTRDARGDVSVVSVVPTEPGVYNVIFSDARRGLKRAVITVGERGYIPPNALTFDLSEASEPLEFVARGVSSVHIGVPELASSKMNDAQTSLTLTPLRPGVTPVTFVHETRPNKTIYLRISGNDDASKQETYEIEMGQKPLIFDGRGVTRARATEDGVIRVSIIDDIIAVSPVSPGKSLLTFERGEGAPKTIEVVVHGALATEP